MQVKFEQQLNRITKSGLFLFFLLASPSTSLLARPLQNAERERRYCLDSRYLADTRIVSCSRALQAFPLDGRLWIQRGLARKVKNDYPAALQDLNRGLELSPQAAKAYHKRGQIWLKLQNFGEAEKDFSQALKLGHTNAEIYADRAFSFHQQSKFELARADYDRVIALSKDDTHLYAYFMRGRLWHEQGQFMKALDDYNRSLVLGGNPKFIFMERGLLWYQLGNYEKALADYNWVLEEEPTHVIALHNRALVWLQMKDYRQAEMDCTRSLSLQPDYAEGYYTLAFIAKKSYQHELVVYNLSQYLKLQSQNNLTQFGEIFHMRAWAFALLGKYPEAHADILSMIASSPSSSLVARFTQAWIFYLQGEITQSRQLLAQVLHQAPASEWSSWLQDYLPELFKGIQSDTERESLKNMLKEAQEQESHTSLSLFCDTLLRLKERS
ncbi:MAG: tetratricopeptide repeat protein [Candidatus Sericytochromatia bacterium]